MHIHSLVHTSEYLDEVVQHMKIEEEEGTSENQQIHYISMKFNCLCLIQHMRNDFLV